MARMRLWRCRCEKLGLIMETASAASANSGSSADRSRSLRLPRGDAVILGPGDDAILRARDGRGGRLHRSPHRESPLPADWSPAYDIGRRAAAANLADIVAMGAAANRTPHRIRCATDLPVQWALDLVDGLRDECLVVAASIAGGDVSSADTVVLGISSFGDLQGPADPRRRSSR